MLGNVGAVLTVLKAMEQRAKLLGLHPPTRPHRGSATSARKHASKEPGSLFDFDRLTLAPM